jgi:hypothetical protein
MALILNLWSSDDDNPSERWDSSWLSVVVVLAIGMHALGRPLRQVGSTVF